MASMFAAVCGSSKSSSGLNRSIRDSLIHFTTAGSVAEALNLTRAEVHGVMSFYHDFRTEPAGRHVVRLCRAEACQAMGGAGLAEIAKARLGVDWHQTSADGVTLEPVFCLGLCACAPAAMVDGTLHGRLDRDALETLLTEVRA